MSDYKCPKCGGELVYYRMGLGGILSCYKCKIEGVFYRGESIEDAYVNLQAFADPLSHLRGPLLVDCFVPGRPVPEGALGINPRTHTLYHVRSKALNIWRESIKLFSDRYKLRKGYIHDGPVIVSAKFCYTRPKCHFGKGRNVKVLREDAAAWPIADRAYADTDKLQRALGDALQGVIISDDRLIVLWSQLCKVFGNESGVFVKVWEVKA